MKPKQVDSGAKENKNIDAKEAREKANQAARKIKDAKTARGKLKTSTDRSMTRKEKATNRSIINAYSQAIKTYGEVAREAQSLAKKKQTSPNFFRKDHAAIKNSNSEIIVKPRKRK